MVFPLRCLLTNERTMFVERSFMSKFLACLLFCLFFSSLACAAASDPQDPYETFNRHMYAMNKTLDKAIIKPVAKTYQKVLPKPLTKGITNFFDNLSMLPTVANDLLQANFHGALSDSWRFIFNSSIGIGGLFDVASHIGLPPHNENFGLTLAKWGYKQSSYLVLPLLGPSTIRDTIGIPVDYYAFSVYPYIQRVALRNSLLTLYYVNQRAQLLPFDNVIKQAALDPYVFERNAYLQFRRSQIAKNSRSFSDNESSTPEEPNGAFIGIIPINAPRDMPEANKLAKTGNTGENQDILGPQPGENPANDSTIKPENATPANNKAKTSTTNSSNKDKVAHKQTPENSVIADATKKPVTHLDATASAKINNPTTHTINPKSKEKDEAITASVQDNSKKITTVAPAIQSAATQSSSGSSKSTT